MNDRTNGAADAAHPNQGEPASEPIAPAKRGGTRAQERIAGLDSQAADTSARVRELEQRLEAALLKADEAEAGWQRARADFANLKRRTEEARAGFATVAGDRLLVRVLDLADDFDLAVSHVPDGVRDTPWVQGVSAIDRKLRALLEAEGISPLEGEGLPFDPQTQQAISHEDTADAPDGTVIRVMQRGYAIGDRVLRPALVAVARNDQTTTHPDDRTNDKE